MEVLCFNLYINRHQFGEQNYIFKKREQKGGEMKNLRILILRT